MLATDLDGTVVRGDGTVSARTVAALRAARDRGWHVVLVTGRPPRWVDAVAEPLEHLGLVVAANGAVVQDLAAGVVLAEYPLSSAAAAGVVHAVRRIVPDAAFAVEWAPSAGGGFGCEPGYRTAFPRPADVVLGPVEDLIGAPMLKLLARHDATRPDDLLDRAERAIDVGLATVTHSSTVGLLEVSGPGVTKAATLSRVAADLGVSAAQVLAFGDMPNDLPLLAWAGRPYAVANAHPRVLAAVPNVTGSVDDDGVAAVVEAYLRLPAPPAAR